VTELNIVKSNKFIEQVIGKAEFNISQLKLSLIGDIFIHICLLYEVAFKRYDTPTQKKI